MIDYNMYIITLKNNNKTKLNLLDNRFNKNIICYGINGNDISRDNIKIYTNTLGKYIPKAAFGCFTSHFLLWKHIITNKEKSVNIIMEDDTILDYDLFINNYEKILNIINNNNILFLYQDHINFNPNFITINKIYSTGAYIMSLGTMEKIYNYYLNNGIDTHLDKSLSYSLKYNNINIKLFNIGKTFKNNSNMMDNKNTKNYLLKFANTQTYYEILFPYLTFNSLTINLYSIFIILLIIIGILFVFIKNIYNSVNIKFINFILSFFFFIIGVLIWDGLDLFILLSP